MMLCSFTLVACDDKDDKAPINAGENNSNDNNDNNNDKKDEPTIPEGYKLYDNGDISFAYPDDWNRTDGSTVMLMNPTGAGNNITVVYEAKTDMYEKMSVTEFNAQMKPAFEAMGMTITNVAINHSENGNGLDITKISLNNSYANVNMKQTMYIMTVGQRTYTVTVTEATSDAALVKNVFDTLTLVK